jgi:hypothetical protein
MTASGDILFKESGEVLASTGACVFYHLAIGSACLPRDVDLLRSLFV